MKKITFVFLFLSTLFLVGCNSITENELESKAVEFIELYFDDSILELEETCLSDEDNIDSDIQTIRNYYNEYFSQYLTDSELSRFTEQIGMHEMSRMMIESACLDEEVNISNINVSLKSDLSQDINIVEFELILQYKEFEYDMLYGEIKFNSDLKIERFHIIGTK